MNTRHVIAVAGFALAVLVAVPASAVLVTSAGASQGVIQIVDAGEGLVYEATVVADPNTEPIWKTVETDGTAGTIVIEEHLWVGEGPWLTDWHEQLMVPNPLGGWMDSPEDDGLGWEVVSVEYPVVSGLTVGNTGELATVLWPDGLPPGTAIKIVKHIKVPVEMEAFAIKEWPTIPEPSVLVLVALGLLASVRRRT